MNKQDSAVLGAGCFWCVEAIFQDLKGVSEVQSGYTGGHSPNPDYKSVCSGNTGHAEVIKVEFDPQIDPQRWLAERGIPSDAPMLLGVGTKAHQKGFDRLVDWFVDLADRHPQLQLVLVGLEAKPYRARNQQADSDQQMRFKTIFFQTSLLSM